MKKYPDISCVKRAEFRTYRWLLLTALLCFAMVGPTYAQGRSRLTLKNGQSFEGKFSSINKIAKNLAVRNVVAGGVQVRNIVIVDDDLRRTYFPKRNLVPPISDAEQGRVVRVNDKRAKAGKMIGTLGAVRGAEPFDEMGRRRITVMTRSGWRSVVQEIVEISPVYTRLQSREVSWDMRMATSNISSADLRSILTKSAKKPAEKFEARLELVRILFLSNRYQEAAQELGMILKEFPEISPEQKEQLERQQELLVQQGAQMLLEEISLRRTAGQHLYASFLLRGLLKEESNIGATENRIEAGEMLAEYDKAIGQGKDVLELMQPLVEKKTGNLPREKMIRDLFEELKNDLNINNLDRMADFLRLARGGNLTDDEKLAIGISGWLLGQGQVVKPNLDIASSLLDVRNLTRDYLRAMGSDAATKAQREELIGKIKQREGGSPKYVAQLLKNMKPPMDLPAATDVVNQYTVAVPNTAEGFPVEYVVQLPPEYDPYMKYPTVVSLHMAGSAPQAQINWWAGKYDEKRGQRVGQASRHGYIVIAPKWAAPNQTKYEYSAKEHNVVLSALRDASRRFSIDSDRVFISGHALGGDAAWDIAVSHPDLWAGMVLIGAKSDYGREDSPLYTTFYDKNPKNFPMYFVYGELDSGKMADSAAILNDYFDPGYDPIVVQYKGRGNEHFYEEIIRIFDWMNLHQRSMPTEFEVDTMRPWDNFFWFTEFEGFSANTMVSPFEWPKKKPASTQIEARISNNHIRVKSGATKTTVWLSPEIVNFDERVRISVNGKEVREDFQPDLEILLEDARKRSDRQHVYWSKVQARSR